MGATREERARQNINRLVALDEKNYKIINWEKHYIPHYENLEKDLDYLELVEIGVIIPLELPLGTKFHISSAMVHLLNLKEVLSSLPTNDANMYVINFIGIYTCHNLLRVSQKVIRLRLFPFSYGRSYIMVR